MHIGYGRSCWFNRLLNYVKDFWLKKIGAARLSAYLVPNQTNNAVESWHRSLNRKMVGKHLTLWRFLGSIHFFTRRKSR